MSEHGLEHAVTPALPAPTRSSWLRAMQAPAHVAWLLSGVVAVLALAYFIDAEDDAGSVLFASTVTASIGAILVLVSRRLLFASAMTATFVAAAHIVAFIKQQTSELGLHAYEVVALLTSWSAVAQFWSEYRRYAVMLLGAAAAAALLGWLVWRLDGTRIRRAHAAAATLVLVALTAAGVVARGERRHTEFYFESRYVSFFYVSWAETIEALWRGHLIEAAPRAAPLGFAGTAACRPAQRPPHIILIHEESVVPPGFFPGLAYDRGLDSFFQSADGVLRKLRVETFGGASWLSEFSVLAGLSSRSFHGMQQFVQPFTTGRLADALPRTLARCGYRTVMFTPMLNNFLNSGKFFRAAGIAEIRDAKDQHATRANERDRFYFANALGEIEAHVKASTDPLFIFLQTMATHGEYDYAYMPEVEVAGGGPGTHPEVHEYLRRLAMARSDYAEMRGELARRFPDDAFLIVHYGDHQPTAARLLHGFGEGASIEDVMRGAGDAQLTTYYALDAIGYPLPPLPALESIDIAYLGTSILEAAGLPLPDTYRERRRLMLLCGGRYYDCPARQEILALHRRLIEAGLLGAR
jgi:hypothetical protein